MFVRLKQVRGKRYAYLVEGKRDGTLVRQRVLRYLGPLAKVASGVPEGTLKVGRGELKQVNESLRRIPLTFEEFEEARRLAYLDALPVRPQGFLTKGRRKRAMGEAEALSALSRCRFNQAFTKVGKRNYRMK